VFISAKELSKLKRGIMIRVEDEYGFRAYVSLEVAVRAILRSTKTKLVLHSGTDEYVTVEPGNS
jgi:hypothetical protein